MNRRRESLYVSYYASRIGDNMHDLTHRILDALSKGPMTPDEVAKSLGILVYSPRVFIEVDREG